MQPMDWNYFSSPWQKTSTPSTSNCAVIGVTLAKQIQTNSNELDNLLVLVELAKCVRQKHHEVCIDGPVRIWKVIHFRCYSLIYFVKYRDSRVKIFNPSRIQLIIYLILIKDQIFLRERRIIIHCFWWVSSMVSEAEMGQKLLSNFENGSRQLNYEFSV